MKQIIQTLFCFFLLLTSFHGWSQQKQPLYPDTLFSTYYHQRVSLFRAMPQTKEDIIFLGNSITDGGEWSEQFADLRIKNRGISGDITIGVLNRLDEIYTRQPEKVFLLIGTNDLARNIPPDSVAGNIFRIAALVKKHSPKTTLYVQSIFPVNEKFGKFSGHTSKRQQIDAVNKQCKAEPQKHCRPAHFTGGDNRQKCQKRPGSRQKVNRKRFCLRPRHLFLLPGCQWPCLR